MSCSVEGCVEKVNKDATFCRKHWFMLPMNIREMFWDFHFGKSRKHTLPAAREAAMKFITSQGEPK